MAELVPTNSGLPMAGSGAMPFGGDGVFSKFNGFLGQPAVRKMLPWFVGIAGLGLAALTWSMVVPAPQRVLYSTLADGERAEVAAALDQAGIDYQIDSGTGAVSVGEDELYRARMMVASQGALAMPESGTQMIDSLPMGASRTLEGDRLRAAQERELQLTIAEIDGVESVRVHLAKADKSVFVRENGEPSASVMLRLVRGKRLNHEQVRAIANLVAASVVGLTAESVRVVDQHGQLISDMSNASDEDDGLDLQARTEAKMREQLIQLLSPIVGANAFSSEVQVELNMDEQTSARESYDKEGAVRSEATSETTTSERRAAGIPGATSNTPPADPEAEERAPNGEAGAANGEETERNGSSNASRTFELGREVLVTSSVPGQVSRVSVAVAIDEAALGDKPDEELAKIEKLVAAAVGANPDRGDNVAVMARKFQTTEMEEAAFWETPWFATILRNVVALISVLLVLLLAVRPLLKAVTKKAAGGKSSDEDDDASDEENDLENDPDVLLGQGDPSVSSGAEKGRLSEQIALARRMTTEQPDDALQALRRMLREQPAPENDEAEPAGAA